MFFLVENCTVFAKTDTISILGNCWITTIPIISGACAILLNQALWR